MSAEEKKKNRILDMAFQKFTTVGISQVTMDDIARGVGMGKGTLYKYFPSKEYLLMCTIDFFADKIEKSIVEVITNNSISPLEKLNLLLKTITERLSKINPATLDYFETYMPEVYEKIEMKREEIIMRNFAIFFDEGKMSGIFDPGIDSKLVAHMFIGSISYILETKVLSTMNYSLDQLFTSIITMIFQGCLTDEGRKHYVKTV